MIDAASATNTGRRFNGAAGSAVTAGALAELPVERAAVSGCSGFDTSELMVTAMKITTISWQGMEIKNFMHECRFFSYA